MISVPRRGRLHEVALLGAAATVLSGLWLVVAAATRWPGCWAPGGMRCQDQGMVDLIVQAGPPLATSHLLAAVALLLLGLTLRPLWAGALLILAGVWQGWAAVQVWRLAHTPLVPTGERTFEPDGPMPDVSPLADTGRFTWLAQGLCLMVAGLAVATLLGRTRAPAVRMAGWLTLLGLPLLALAGYGTAAAPQAAIYLGVPTMVLLGVLVLSVLRTREPLEPQPWLERGRNGVPWVTGAGALVLAAGAAVVGLAGGVRWRSCWQICGLTDARWGFAGDPSLGGVEMAPWFVVGLGLAGVGVVLVVLGTGRPGLGGVTALVTGGWLVYARRHAGLTVTDHPAYLGDALTVLEWVAMLGGVAVVAVVWALLRTGREAWQWARTAVLAVVPVGVGASFLSLALLRDWVDPSQEAMWWELLVALSAGVSAFLAAYAAGLGLGERSARLDAARRADRLIPSVHSWE